MLPSNWLMNTNIKYTYRDPSDSSYILEIKIPWSELEVIKPRNGTSMDFGIFLGDSDLEEDRKESILSWGIKKGSEWYVSSTKYGSLILTNNEQITNEDDIAYCTRIKDTPIIDGVIDKLWNKVDYYPINIMYRGRINSSYDNSGKFKSAWNDNGLYFLFDVTDNCKNKAGFITKDKCWIEDAITGELVWKMQADTSQIPFPVFKVNKQIHLKAGKYLLHYSSDKNNSFEGWYGKTPKTDYYGAFLFLNKD